LAQETPDGSHNSPESTPLISMLSRSEHEAGWVAGSKSLPRPIVLVGSWLLSALYILMAVAIISLSLAIALALISAAVIYAASFILGSSVLTHPTILFDYVPRLWSAVNSPTWIHYELPTLFLAGWVLGLYVATVLATGARERLDEHEEDLPRVTIIAAYVGIVVVGMIYVVLSATSMYRILLLYFGNLSFPILLIGVCAAGIISAAVVAIALAIPDGGSAILELVSTIGSGLGFVLSIIGLVAVYFVIIGLFLILLWPFFGRGVFFGPYHNLIYLPSSWQSGAGQVAFWLGLITVWEFVAFGGSALISLAIFGLDMRFDPLPKGIDATLRIFRVVFVLASVGVAGFVGYDHVAHGGLLIAVIFATTSGAIALAFLKVAPVIAVMKWFVTPAVWLFRRWYDRHARRKWYRVGERDGYARADRDAQLGNLLTSQQDIESLARAEAEADENDAITTLHQQRAYRRGFMDGYLEYVRRA
jgi:hypothetical protein